jgi:hypothetical protein
MKAMFKRSARSDGLCLRRPIILEVEFRSSNISYDSHFQSSYQQCVCIPTMQRFVCDLREMKRRHLSGRINALQARMGLVAFPLLDQSRNNSFQFSSLGRVQAISPSLTLRDPNPILSPSVTNKLPRVGLVPNSLLAKLANKLLSIH